MPRGSFDNRYLRSYEGGVQIRIVRLGVNYSRKFHYRLHGGEKLTKEKARRHRDRVYEEIFGVKLIDSSHLLKPRGESKCPAGISEVKDSNGLVIARIISWQSSLNHTERHYMPITDGDLEAAIAYRVQKITQKYLLEENQ